MSLYRILSALLSYPAEDLLAALPEIRAALAQDPQAADTLAPLLDFLAAHPLIPLQENYVACFDRTPSHSLHLFEHVHGESRDRGQAMVDLLQAYRQHGFEPAVNELPDYVPLFLEYLGLIPAEDARAMLGEAIHVLAAIGQRLARDESPYAAPFVLLRALSPVEPREQDEPPLREMEDTLETFGPGADGVEPLLQPAPGGAQPIRFHRQRPQSAAA